MLAIDSVLKQHSSQTCDFSVHLALKMTALPVDALWRVRRRSTVAIRISDLAKWYSAEVCEIDVWTLYVPRWPVGPVTSYRMRMWWCGDELLYCCCCKFWPAVECLIWINTLSYAAVLFYEYFLEDCCSSMCTLCPKQSRYCPDTVP
jgi:hypothetical protein